MIWSCVRFTQGLRRVHTGFEQGSGFPPFHWLIAVGSKEEVVKYFQKNYKTTEGPPRYRYGSWRLDVCIFCPSLTIFRFHFVLSRTANAVCAPAAYAPDPSHTEKVFILRFCTKSHDSHDFVPKFAGENTHFFGPWRRACTVIHTWSQRDAHGSSR